MQCKEGHPGSGSAWLFWLCVIPLCFSISITPPVRANSSAPRSAVKYSYRVVESYPHSTNAFTQGLVLDRGVLYESTGRYGSSTLRSVELVSGKPLQMVPLPGHLFGEGITVFQNQIFQLTWKAGVVRIYDRATFRMLRSVSFPYEGWGLTNDRDSLIVSDGSQVIRFLDPDTLAVQRMISVVGDKGPVTRLNELEYIDGFIYANVWKTDQIVIIDPVDGRVRGRIDLDGLLGREEKEKADVLNGIAYDRGTGRLLVTGKLWPRLFVIEAVPGEK